MNPLFCDIETGPCSEDKAQAFMPEFEAPANYKDPEKIKAHLDAQRKTWRESCALSALTGNVLCVGMMDDVLNFMVREGDEKEIIASTFSKVMERLHCGSCVVGFCIRSFDMPFLIRRAWALGVEVPATLFDRGRYLHESIIDVAERWACGSRDPRDRISLKNLATHLGIGEKTGDGADFAQLYATDRTKALEYLRTDLVLTKAAYERMMFTL